MNELKIFWNKAQLCTSQMGTWEGKKMGGKVPAFAFELIQKAVILFILASGTLE